MRADIAIQGATGAAKMGFLRRRQAETRRDADRWWERETDPGPHPEIRYFMVDDTKQQLTMLLTLLRRRGPQGIEGVPCETQLEQVLREISWKVQPPVGGRELIAVLDYCLDIILSYLPGDMSVYRGVDPFSNRALFDPLHTFYKYAEVPGVIAYETATGKGLGPDGGLDSWAGLEHEAAAVVRRSLGWGVPTAFTSIQNTMALEWADGVAQNGRIESSATSMHDSLDHRPTSDVRDPAAGDFAFLGLDSTATRDDIVEAIRVERRTWSTRQSHPDQERRHEAETRITRLADIERRLLG